VIKNIYLRKIFLFFLLKIYASHYEKTNV